MKLLNGVRLLGLCFAGISLASPCRALNSLSDCIEVLQQDPQNAEAHTAIRLMAQQWRSERTLRTHRMRMELLTAASKQIDSQRRDPRVLEKAIADTVEAETAAKNSREVSLCEQAETEAQLRHWYSAHEVILKLLQENNASVCGQRILSVLQSEVHRLLASDMTLSSTDRYVLEGFYAYGQADYAKALTAWDKAVTLDASSATYHYDAFRSIAAGHVQQDLLAKKVQRLFAEGVALYDQGSYRSALDLFRRVAIANPEYPQLAAYLARTEAAAEEERVKHLDEEKKSRIAALFEKGMQALQDNQWGKAQTYFQNLLQLDPSHPQATAYLAMATAEIQRQVDPVAAQHHYEVGLVAYASGNLDDAKREWRIAARMNPRLEKVTLALAKVEKELASYREVP